VALNIKDPETDLYARRLASLTGRSITEAVKLAVQEQVAREEKRQGKASWDEIRALMKRAAARPILDPRTPDEIIGYDEHGLPR
jgi:antitoxin VapB